MEEFVFNKYKEQKFILDNGLTIHYFPYPDYHTSYCGFVIPYGSNMSNYLIDGKRVKTGIAHFLEHRMFDSKDGDFSKKFAEIGAFCNAYTFFDRTCYYCQTTYDSFEAFKILYDLVFNFYSTRKRVINERLIIIQEMLEGISSPRDEMTQYLNSKFFNASVLKTPIIGKRKDINSTTLEDLETAYEAFYRIEDMKLIVVGPQPIEQIIDYINKMSPKIHKKQHVVEKINDVEDYSKQEKAKVVKLKRDISNKIQYLKIKVKVDDLYKKYGKYYYDNIINYSLSLLFDSGSEFLEEFYSLDVAYNSLDYGYIDVDGDAVLTLSYISNSSVKPNRLIKKMLMNPIKYINQRNLDLYNKRMYGKKLVYLQSTNDVFQNVTIDIKGNYSFLKSLSNEKKVLLNDVFDVIKYFSNGKHIKGVLIPKSK